MLSSGDVERFEGGTKAECDTLYNQSERRMHLDGSANALINVPEV